MLFFGFGHQNQKHTNPVNTESRHFLVITLDKNYARPTLGKIGSDMFMGLGISSII